MSDESTVTLRGRFVDDISPGVKKVTDALPAMGEAARSSLKPWHQEMESLNASLQDNILRLRAQKDLLQDPVYQQSVKQAATLRDEVNALTKSTTGHGEALKAADTVEKGIFSNMRTRREALVMAHEAMMGKTKNLMGSAMVFAEYADLSIMHTITSMINPTTIAIAAVTAATIGATVALYEMTEKAAEHWHAMSLIAEETGTTTIQMIAFEHAAIGTGVTTKTLATAFERFTLNLGKHREELERVGVTAKDPIQAFEQLMDVAKRTTDPIERNRILSDALGGSWRQLAPLVMQGGDALRDAVAEMKIPKDVQEDYEKINKLEIEMAKNWDLIKKNSGSAMSSIMVQVKEFKSELIAIAAQKGLMAGILAALNPRYHAESSLEIERQKSADAWFRNGPGTAAAGSSLSHDDQDALAKLIEKNKKEIRKNSLADALKDEEKAYQDDLALLKRGGQTTEDETRAHEMRVAEIRKSFANKAPKSNAMKGYENDAEIANYWIKSERAYKEDQKKKSEESLKGAKKRAAEELAEEVKEIDRAAKARALVWTIQEKGEKAHQDRIQKIQEMKWDIQREHEEHNAKMVEGAWTSAAQGIQGVFSSAFQEIGKKNGDMMQVMADGFENLINKMIADLAANAAIFGLLSLVAPEGLAASFAANAGGLTGAIFGQKSTMLPSFDVGTRGLASDGALYGHKDEAIFPAPVSRAMHAGDWAPAMRFMGQGGNSSTTSTSSQTNHITVNVAGTNASPDDIAKSLSRALQVQQRKGARSSF